jgi:hypothetical protein
LVDLIVKYLILISVKEVVGYHKRVGKNC